MKSKFTLLAILISFVAVAQIPNDSLSLWLRSDTGVVTNFTGSGVTVWNDISGHNRNAISVSPAYPQIIQNEICGKPVIRFNGITTYFKTPEFANFSDKRGTLFVVVKVNGAGNGAGGYGTFISTFYGSGVDWQFGAYSTSSYAFYDGSGGSNVSFNTSPPSSWGILTLNRKYDDSISFFKSGVLAANLAIANTQPSVNELKIGSKGNPYEVLNGDIAEILIYNKSLSAQELYNVNTYLANRYCFNTNVPQPVCQNQTSCGPTSFSLTATGGYKYKWYNSATSLQPIDTSATYVTPVLLISDTFYVANYNDTLESIRTQVIANVLPSPSTPTISLVTADLLSTPANAYQWFLNGSVISGANSQSYTPQQNGFYTVQITDANNCLALSLPFNYNITGLNQLNVTAFSIYPNPSDGVFSVKLPDANKSLITIYNSLGEVVGSITFSSSNSLLDISYLPDGVYTLQLNNDNTTVLHRRIVIDKVKK